MLDVGLLISIIGLPTDLHLRIFIHGNETKNRLKGKVVQRICQSSRILLHEFVQLRLMTTAMLTKCNLHQKFDDYVAVVTVIWRPLSTKFVLWVDVSWCIVDSLKIEHFQDLWNGFLRSVLVDGGLYFISKLMPTVRGLLLYRLHDDEDKILDESPPNKGLLGGNKFIFESPIVSLIPEFPTLTRQIDHRIRHLHHIPMTSTIVDCILYVKVYRTKQWGLLQD